MTPGFTIKFSALLLFVILTSTHSTYSQSRRTQNINKEKREFLASLFSQLMPIVSDDVYTISLCADVPDNLHPNHVYVQNEPGHVFLTFSKKGIPGCGVSFGFYPWNPIGSVFFKKVNSRILINECREYDVSITSEVTGSQLEPIINKAIQLCGAKYDIKHYNCYDYALDIYNLIPGIHQLPRHKSRFPFIVGKGGSPCTLYRDMEIMKAKEVSYSGVIRFGLFQSPPYLSMK